MILLGRILIILLFVTICEGFFNIDISRWENGTTSRLNLTCSYYDGTENDCDYCVYQLFSNGSSTSIISYDCIQITNTYKSISKRCQGFEDKTDIGYGICSPLYYELFDLSILCICATNMCNNNLTSCRSSVDYQIQSNTSPSLLPQIIDHLSTPISCFDTMVALENSSNTSYYCAEYASPYIDIQKCNEYVINNTLLCAYIVSQGDLFLLSMPEDMYKMFLSGAIEIINENNQDSNVKLFSNESSSYFYINWIRTYNDNSTSISNRCFCDQDNCNYNLTNCLNANKSISIKNVATKNLNSTIFVSIWVDLIIKILLPFVSTKLIFHIK